MMASPSELSLDCKPLSYSMLLKSFGEQTEQTQKLEEFLARLEEERLKIDAFKRELPLCMQLLTNAMEASRQQLQSYRANQGARPVLEEFIPLKHASSEGSDKAANSSDKANWMTSAQLWSQASDHVTKQPLTTAASPKETDHTGIHGSPKLGLDSKHRNGGAFLPFSKDRSSCASPTLRTLPELALVSSGKDMEDKKNIEIDTRRESFAKGNNGVAITTEQGKGGSCQADQSQSTATATATTQTQRKARRCWSPDLHRRFVNALQMLGGSQVATPKQIRELMKVDGLTNDEVKSHLQKYRLHTRRPSPSPQTAATAATQLVVLGGIWVPPEYATAAHGGAPATLYSPHPTTHASPHYCASPVPQEFYTAPTPPHHQFHHHPLHHQFQVYNGPLQTQNSPESDARGNGDQSESIEDGKSESSSWKADSTGAEMEGKERLWSSEKQEKLSNGSEISLKF